MLTEERKVFAKSVDAIGYALYNAAAIFNNPPRVRYCPCYVSQKKPLTFDDVPPRSRSFYRSAGIPLTSAPS